MELSENDAPSSNATQKRRVSGRAVRAPEKFVPDAPPSQSGNTGGKRKRGANHTAEDIENEVDLEEDESDDDEAESPDEEELRQSRRKAKNTKKPVAKKAKVNGATPDAPAPAVSLPNRQKKPKKVVIQDENAEGLYGEHENHDISCYTGLTHMAAQVFTSGESSDAVATTWLAQYEADNTASMTDLVNCILKSAGCEMKVTEDDVNDPDNIPSKLDEMQDEYKGVCIAPPTSELLSSHDSSKISRIIH
jgi:cohesin complex subunit SA-1/2